MLFLAFFITYTLTLSFSLVLDPKVNPNVVDSRQFRRNKTNNWYIFRYELIPDGPSDQKYIAYAIDTRFRDWQKQYIKDQFKKITSKTCLQTVEYEFNDASCNSGVSCIRLWKQPEPSNCRTNWKSRDINLPDHCFDDKWVLHEILHVLGFGHEHSRLDRDCYVEVTGPGLTDPAYDLDRDIDISFPYDVHSIMHYRRGDHIKPASFAWDQKQEFGSYDELTEMDVIALNYMFCGGQHYCETNPQRCQYFRCWIECNPCSDEPIRECKDCTGNTY